ncbi:MAG: heavy-metal-associated domain-containing protein [Phycisphaerales bacterium]
MNPTEVTIAIAGMSCEHCVRAVRDALAAVPGLLVKSVEIGRASVEELVPGATRGAIRALDDAGFEGAVGPSAR